MNPKTRTKREAIQLRILERQRRVRPEDLLAAGVARALSPAGERDGEREHVKIANVPYSAVVGMVGLILESFGVELSGLTRDPGKCEHPLAVASSTEVGRCQTCGIAFTRAQPSPRCRPCERCQGLTCVCGCGTCIDPACAPPAPPEPPPQ